MASAKVMMQLPSGGEEDMQILTINRISVDLNLETHEYKAGVLTSQNNYCGWLDKTSVLYSGGSVFNCQLEDQLS
jgi:hypothetical protein